MKILDNLFYTKDHEWVLIEGNIATVGITDFAQSELGDIVYVDINTLGDTVEANAVFGSIEAVKTVSDLFMPVTGEVVEINAALDSNPELINSDAYNEGWIVKVKIDGEVNTKELLDAEGYRNIIGL